MIDDKTFSSIYILEIPDKDIFSDTIHLKNFNALLSKCIDKNGDDAVSINMIKDFTQEIGKKYLVVLWVYDQTALKLPEDIKGNTLTFFYVDTKDIQDIKSGSFFRNLFVMDLPRVVSLNLEKLDLNTGKINFQLDHKWLKLSFYYEDESLSDSKPILHHGSFTTEKELIESEG